jgi:hypothetical protein
MNPRYSRPLVDLFTDRLVEEYRTGSVTGAIVLLNNVTSTRFFQQLAAISSVICLIEKRLSFWGPDESGWSPRYGQAVFYFGDSPNNFLAAFADYGWCGAPVVASSNPLIMPAAVRSASSKT